MGDQRLDEVLTAAGLGEAWALRVVYDELSPRVLGYLRGRGAAEPEDLTSEVFLAVLPRLATVTGGAAGLRTLLFSVAHARLVDDLRRRARRVPAVALDDTVLLPTSPSAETVALGQAGADRVREVLAGLPDDQREVLLMRIVGDLTVDQVAAAMGRSAGAVKQLQRRGLLELRARLADGRVTL